MQGVIMIPNEEEIIMGVINGEHERINQKLLKQRSIWTLTLDLDKYINRIPNKMEFFHNLKLALKGIYNVNLILTDCGFSLEEIEFLFELNIINSHKISIKYNEDKIIMGIINGQHHTVRHILELHPIHNGLNNTLDISKHFNSIPNKIEFLHHLKQALNGTNIKSIVFNDCEFTTEEIECLFNNLPSGLQTLTLRKCNINADGAALIAKALPHHQQLRTLNLKNNLIDNQGAADLIEATAHPENTLTTLMLDENLIHNSNLKLIKDAIPQSKLVNLSLKGHNLSNQSIHELTRCVVFSQVKDFQISDRPQFKQMFTSLIAHRNQTQFILQFAAVVGQCAPLPIAEVILEFYDLSSKYMDNEVNLDQIIGSNEAYFSMFVPQLQEPQQPEPNLVEEQPSKRVRRCVIS